MVVAAVVELVEGTVAVAVAEYDPTFVGETELAAGATAAGAGAACVLCVEVCVLEAWRGGLALGVDVLPKGSEYWLSPALWAAALAGAAQASTQRMSAVLPGVTRGISRGYR